MGTNHISVSPSLVEEISNRLVQKLYETPMTEIKDRIDSAIKSVTTTTITGAGQQTMPTPSWFGVFGTPMFLDEVITTEMRKVRFEEADPAGNTYNRWLYAHTLLQSAETTATPSDPTLKTTTLVPVACQAVTEISVAAFNRLVRLWNRAVARLNGAGYGLSENDFLVQTFAYAAMASKLYADLGGGMGFSGITVYNGWIHNLTNNTFGTPVTTYAHPGGAPFTLDWPNTVLPGIRSAMAGNAHTARFLNRRDLVLYCSVQEKEAILAQTQTSDDFRGYVRYDEATGRITWLGCEIVALSDWPNAELVMTVRENMVSLLVEAPMTVEKYKQDPKNGQLWTIAVPMTSIAGVIDGAACAFIT